MEDEGDVRCHDGGCAPQGVQLTVAHIERSASAYAESRFGAQAVLHLRAAFDESRNPMLIADDYRRWVTGNTAACELFGIAPAEVPWHTIDDFTPVNERGSLKTQWNAFLSTGAAEGWHRLSGPGHRPVSIEFSATANVLPARHLTVFVAPESAAQQPMTEIDPPAVSWSPVQIAAGHQVPLTERERAVMTMVASGLQTGEIADRLYLSPETIKSHVQNAMGKLGAHTRAHAVAIGLVTGQIIWTGPSGD